MRSWLSLLLMSVTGLMLSVRCMSRPIVEPYAGEAFFVSLERLEEYEALACLGAHDYEGCKPQAPKVRAWIREADRVIRSNNALRGD